MVTAVRLVGLGSLATIVLGLGISVTGCAVPVDSGAAATRGETPDLIAVPIRRASAAAPNVDCQLTGWTMVTATPLSEVTIPHTGLTITNYQGSVADLLAGNVNDTDQAVYRFTGTYSQIPAAAGYYYEISNFNVSPTAVDTRMWVAIPLLDAESDLPPDPLTREATYPGIESVRFPVGGTRATFLYGFADGDVDWGDGYTPEGYWVGGLPSYVYATTPVLAFPTQPVFDLTDASYGALATVMGTPAATDPEVVAQDKACVLIVDQNGHPLDYAAHIAEWDPEPSCSGCTVLHH